MAHRTTKLPRSIPESLRYKKPEPTPLIKARAHHKRAEKLRDEDRERLREGDSDPTKPHLQYLERMKSLMSATESMAAQAKKEFQGKLGRDEIGPHEVLGHLIGTLPRPRLDLIFKMEQIGKLNALILRPGRQIQKVIDHNEDLQELGIRFLDFTSRRRDLKYSLGLQSYKSAQALALYFVVIWKAADPKVRKKENLVQDREVLDLANGILREVATHIIEEMNREKANFLDVGERKTDAIISRGAKKV